MLILRNLRLVFLPKCIISAKFSLSYQKSNFEKFQFRFCGSKRRLVFCFSLFHLDNFLTAFAKDLIKKPPVFITNIESNHNFLRFHKDLRYRNFWQWSDGPLKILWIYHGNMFSLQISAKFSKFETCIYIEMRNFG